MLDADPRRIKRVRIHAAEGRTASGRAVSATRGEPDAVLAGTTPPTLNVEDTPGQKDGGQSSGSPASAHRAVIVTRLAHAIVLAWGWRRALIAFARRRRLGAGAGAVQRLADPVPDFSDAGLAGRRRGRRPLERRRRPRPSPAGASASAISSPGSTGSATRSWSTPRPSAGCCRSRSPACRPYCALYTALGVAAARLLWARGATRVLALAAALTAAEWLRGHLLTGFPWNTFGYALTGPLALAQSAALIGLWGLTFLAVAVFASPAVLADDVKDTPHPWLAPSSAFVILAAFASYGVVRLWQHPTAYVDGVRLRIMQPNLQQDEKFNYAAKAQVMERYLRCPTAPPDRTRTACTTSRI